MRYPFLLFGITTTIVVLVGLSIVCFDSIAETHSLQNWKSLFPQEEAIISEDYESDDDTDQSDYPILEYSQWDCHIFMGVSSDSKTVITSLLVSEDSAYIQGALVLGYSLRRTVDLTNIDTVLMVLDDFELSDKAMTDLIKVGWDHICRVPVIESGFQDEILPRFQKIFAKVTPFAWIKYKRFIFMDLDTLPVGNLSYLLSPKEEEDGDDNICKFSAALDYEGGGFQSHFNSGVFSGCPSLKIFDFFVNFIKTRNDYRIIMGDQGALNKLAEEGILTISPIPWYYNANLAIFESDRQLWDNNQSKLQIIHYTTAKPFNYLNDFTAQQRTWKPIQLWFEQHEQMKLQLSISQ